MTKLKMEVVTPDRKVLSKEVESLIVPAYEGYLGVLPKHAPLVTNLGIGVVTFKAEGSEEKMAVSGGFMEVRDDNVSIMADTAELSGEIDVERAKRAEERARERLKKRSPDLDFIRAERALKRAIARQEAAGIKK
ncbi:MAG: F-type H+-transporting ATPase subunit epsilon [Clostridia bacterium]|nr:F-type H+-transporting ATPase subunit epsilon [Clostridia bacterium]